MRLGVAGASIFIYLGDHLPFLHGQIGMAGALAGGGSASPLPARTLPTPTLKDSWKALAASRIGAKVFFERGPKSLS